VPRSQWPGDPDESRREVWLSKNFLVQVFIEKTGYRITVNRTSMKPDGSWKDRITWDELQNIKRAVHFGDHQAVEIYPPDSEVINDANMRHLWVLTDPLDIGWRE